MTLTAQDVVDLVKTTQRELGPLRFQQIAQSLQYYEVFSKWFKKDKVSFDTGIGIQRTLMTKTAAGAARHVGFLEKDSTNITDVLEQLQVDWRHATTSWGLIYQTDILMNNGASRIVNILKPRRAAALIDMVEELENKAWSGVPSTTDKKLPYGLPYWIVQNATEGFNGGLPGSFTTVGGVNITTTPTFKNWTAQYAAVTKADLVKKMRTAHRKCRFVSPVKVDDYRGGVGDRYRIYVGETVMSSFEDLGEAQNENLGKDIASMDGQMVFRRVPIVWVPKLDEDTTNPMYLIDHSTFYPVVLKGDYLRESDPKENQEAHNAYSIHVDLTYNYVCLDRRRNAVMYK